MFQLTWWFHILPKFQHEPCCQHASGIININFSFKSVILSEFSPLFELFLLLTILCLLLSHLLVLVSQLRIIRKGNLLSHRRTLFMNFYHLSLTIPCSLRALLALTSLTIDIFPYLSIISFTYLLTFAETFLSYFCAWVKHPCLFCLFPFFRNLSLITTTVKLNESICSILCSDISSIFLLHSIFLHSSIFWYHVLDLIHFALCISLSFQ